MSNGYIQAESGQNGCFHDIAAEQQVPSRFLDLLQRDLIRLSDAHSKDHYLHHLPQIHTSNYKMGFTTSADTVTLDADVLFTVGGVTFNTSGLESRNVTIPDSATRYLYAEVAANCGLMSNWTDDPITRTLTVTLTLEESEVASTATKMIVLKAVKGGAGETPVVTPYENNGHAGLFDNPLVTCVVELTSDKAVGQNTTTVLSWDAVKLVVGGAADDFWLAGAPTRIMVPEGYNYAMFGFTGRHTTNLNVDNDNAGYLIVNGSVRVAEGNIGQKYIVGTTIVSPWVAVTGGSDYVEFVYYEQANTPGIQLAAGSCIWIWLRK